MATFKEANKIRLTLKMTLSQFGWYKSSNIVSVDDGYCVVINVTRIDNSVRKQIAPVIDGVTIKMEVE